MENDFKNIINMIFDQFGVDVLLNGNRFCALVEDMALGMTMEKRVIQRLNQETLLPEIYKVVVSSEQIQNRCVRLEVMLDNAGFSEGWKQIVFSAFGFLDGENISMFECEIDDIVEENSVVTELERINIDPKIKDLMDDVFKQISIYGRPVIVENSYKTDISLDLVDGIKINRGFISPYMVRDQKRVETILENPYVLITNMILIERDDIQKIIELISPTKKSILIIATDIEGEALSSLIKKLNSFSCVVVKAPGYGDRRIDILKDLAVLTGGTAIIAEENTSIQNLTLEKLGQAEKIVVHSEETIIVNGKCDGKVLQERIRYIKELKEESISEFEQEKLQERYENLERGVLVIRVGGKTVLETERLLIEIENGIDYFRTLK